MGDIGYLGIPGSFSHAAARAAVPNARRFTGLPSFSDIFVRVLDGRCSQGVVPVENSIAGSIYENYDLLRQHKAHVIGEIYLKVEHHLLAAEGTAIEQIRKVYSHPKAIEQCSKFLHDHPVIEPVAYTDTATAAQHVSQLSNPTVAALAGMEAAGIYNLSVIAHNLEDSSRNYTRFLVISHERPVVAGANKASLIFTLSHVPGSLYHALQKLADEEYNLTKIESRPLIDRPFEYVFYVDFEFPPEEGPRVEEVIEGLRKYTLSLHVLGLYVARKPYE